MYTLFIEILALYSARPHISVGKHTHTPTSTFIHRMRLQAETLAEIGLDYNRAHRKILPNRSKRNSAKVC